MPEHQIWFERPASNWNEALPLGNGLMGAMVSGDPLRAHFDLNDGTAWSGSPASESLDPLDPAVAAKALADARASIARGEYAQADESLRRFQHRYSQTFLPFAALEVTLAGGGEVSDYRRELDLATATHTVRYRLDGRLVVQRSFASYPDGVLAIELLTERSVSVALSTQLLEIPGGNELSLLVRLPFDVAPSHDIVPEPVRYSDDPTLSLQGAVVARVLTGGSGRTVVLIATQTTFDGIGRWPVGTAEDAATRAGYRLDAAAALGIDVLHARHVEDHARLYARVAIETGAPSDLPTDRRLVNEAGSVLARDPAMAGLLFNLGRYLLIASSREGGVPANLQGIWNNSLQPVWSSNYTTNINLQMNYWLAESANLPECLPPLFDLIDALTVSGAATARRLYGARGWVAHHNTDVWAYSQPVGLGEHDPKWAFWPLAPAWLVRHLWDRIEYGADDTFIAGRAWEPIRGAAEFYLDWLVEEADGSLGTSPSTSPENEFYTPSGEPVSVGRSSTSDLAAIAGVFDMLIAIASRLSRESDSVVVRAAAARNRIPGPQFTKSGEIREWADDLELVDPHHRHISPVYFVYPGKQPLSEEQAFAVSRTLDTRADESTGWSLVWKIIVRARLRQPERVSNLLALFFRDMEIDRGPWVGGLYANLLSAHPPFAIDGNLGFVTALAECLVQVQGDEIVLLPALPAELPTGSIRGLVVEGGLKVTVTWREGTLERVTLESREAVDRRSYRLTYMGVETHLALGSNEVQTRTLHELLAGLQHKDQIRSYGG